MPCHAQDAGPAGYSWPLLGPLDEAALVYLACLALLAGLALLAAAVVARRTAGTAARHDRLAARLAEAERLADLRSALLSGEGERLVVYRGGERVETYGTLPKSALAPTDPGAFLNFADWLDPEAAEALQACIERLRAEAEPFRQALSRSPETVVEVVGRTVGSAAVVRFSALEGLRADFQRLSGERDAAEAALATTRRLFDRAPIPAWHRAPTGRLTWVNAAYAEAVGADAPLEAIETGTEFLGAADRERLGAVRDAEGGVSQTLSTVVAADRRQFQVVEAAGPDGSAGLAIDVAETEQVRMELRQTIDSQAETLDQLQTAVARFDAATRLTYYNAAMQQLFDLSSEYLESRPDHLALLDHLRTRGIMPTERYLSSEMRENDLAAYRSTEPVETLWHLANGRTLRVIATPQPQGGATWIFEDITEKLELESQVRATVQLQRETIDYLSEAVAVFGSDGRLRLSNPAFAEMFGFDEDFLQTRPRVHTFPDTARVAIGAPGPRDTKTIVGWAPFASAITAFEDTDRRTRTGEIGLSSNVTAAYAIVPLPNGQTMLTFSDISDAREAERMLREKNEALQTADRIKSDFVQHVNYELRSPLTNIIGFTALLRSSDSGALTERQSEYLDYIATSTSSLLTIVNDILDLATIDAGIMELDLAEVNIAETVDHAAEGVRERIGEGEIGLDIDLSKAGETFRADPHRMTQILFNLLSNAANFAPSGSRIGVEVARFAETIAFSVTDRGPGIAPERLERMFERFESDPAGGRHSGAGLGLSIVKSFVELHGGSIAVRSKQGEGTTVVCTLPLAPERAGAPRPVLEARPATDRADAA